MESLQATTASTSISMVASSEVSRERMAGRDADYLWKEFFRDPSQFRDDPRRKTHRNLWPSHSSTLSEPGGCYASPPWVLEQLRRCQMEYREVQLRGKNMPEEFDRTALLHSIKICGKNKDLSKGRKIHAHIIQRGLAEKDVYMSTALITMYVKCNVLAKAQEVFDEIHVQDVVSWNALLSGYSQHGFGHESLNLFPAMQEQGLLPDGVTFSCLLKACSTIGSISKGQKIHAKLRGNGILQNNLVIGTALVDMYAKCGMLQEAREAFDELQDRDVVSWNALITGYGHHGLSNEALKCYEEMRGDDVTPDAVTFTCVLKVCGSIGLSEKGEEIHVEVSKHGLLKNNMMLGNALVDMYAKCGVLSKAQEVLDKLPVRDTVSWTSLIIGYAQQGLGEEALNSYLRMREEGLSPDSITFACMLKVCGSLGFIEMGEEIHEEIRKQRLLGKDFVLGTALVDMYSKCGLIEKAQEVFDEVELNDACSWTALISGYVQQGLYDEALICFSQMKDLGLSPDSFTFACILKACSSNICFLKKGEEIHAEISNKKGLLENNLALGNALVDMYAKCGAIIKAERVFYKLPAQDTVTWTTLIAGYAHHGLDIKALNCAREMQEKGYSPDVVTYSCILNVCASIGSVEKGEEIHAEIRRIGLLAKHASLGTALIDMYAKCGMFMKAKEVFDELPLRDAVSWTALMVGYGQLGQVKMVVASFNEMLTEGIVPDVITFLVLLNACSNAGLVEEAQSYFHTMTTVYCLIPTLEHHTCMVNLYSHVGHFDKAILTIKRVQCSDRFQLWLALLDGCRMWVNVELGRLAFANLLLLDKSNALAYVCMSNIYAAAGMQAEADEVEDLRMRNGASKISICSYWTDKSNNVHSFPVGDDNHPQRERIYAKLEDIGQKLSQGGFSTQLHWLSKSITENKKGDRLCGCSEMLAVTCGLINTCDGMPLRITKNSRICEDCHFAVALVSKLEKRVIQVKDARRIHIFEDGKCICGK